MLGCLEMPYICHMLKAYKYRLYPTESQKILLEKHFGSCRFIFNLALETKQAAYISARKNLSVFDLIKQIPDLKKDCEWLKEVNAQSLQGAVVNLDKAFTGFFKGKGKYPKFKNKYSRQSFSCPQKVEIDFDGGEIFLPKFKAGIKTVFDKRELKGIIKTATVSRTPTRKYFASILIDNGKDFHAKAKIKEATAIGIDLGIKSFVATSNGDVFENPKFLRNSLQRLKVLQRRVSKKVKGSANRRKAVMRLSLLHEKVSNQRKDYLHKTSTMLIKNHDSICIEDLNVKGMVKNHNLAQAITDVGWGEFVRMLKYKADWYGNNILQIGRFEPSSKLCSTCGTRNEVLSLSDREWTCANCGTYHDRDVNAAINIKAFALRDERISRRGTPVAPVETLRLRRSAKQEYKTLVLPTS